MNWIGVASKEHVQRGREGGFSQVCHGKKGPLSRMRQGDGIIYYSPTVRFREKEKCQEFTAIGKIIGEDTYQVDMGNDFHPFRIDVEYFASQEVSIHTLLDFLSFTRDKRYWGASFRFGLFKITEEDFQTIAGRMIS